MMTASDRAVERVRLFGAGLLTAGILLAGSSAFAADDVERGKTVYNGAGACATCHGPGGKGDGPAGAALNPKPRDLTSPDGFALDTDGDGKKGTKEDIFNVVTNGAQKYGGSFMMVGRPDLPEADRKALAAFVASLSGGK